MFGAMTSLTGGGGLSSSSSASTGPFAGGDSGNIGGGINFGASSPGVAGALSNPVVVIGIVAALYVLSKKR